MRLMKKIKTRRAANSDISSSLANKPNMPTNINLKVGLKNDQEETESFTVGPNISSVTNISSSLRHRKRTNGVSIHHDSDLFPSLITVPQQELLPTSNMEAEMSDIYNMDPELTDLLAQVFQYNLKEEEDKESIISYQSKYNEGISIRTRYRGEARFPQNSCAPRRIRLQQKQQICDQLDPEAVPSSVNEVGLAGSTSQSQNAVLSNPNSSSFMSLLVSLRILLAVKAHNYLEWIFILANLVLETLLVVLDQLASPHKPQYALTAIVVSLGAMAVSVAELAQKARKQRVILKRHGIRLWFQYPSSSHNPFYTFIDVFGFICALCQCIFATIAYSYHRRHADNPINISIVSLIFIICLAFAKFSKDRNDTLISPSI